MTKQYVLAVPNFSEGQRLDVVHAVVDAVKQVESVKVVAVEPEHNFNRTVLTFIVEPKHCEEAMLKMAEVVYKNVNMEIQKGDHPRIGALDTFPVFPLQNVTIEETKGLAEKLGSALFEHFNVPVYFSGLNARTEYKKSNTNIRRGQYEGLKALLEDENHPDYETRKPDLSVDGRLDAKMGACTVTADYEGLVAYNVFVESEDVSIAKQIAKLVKSEEHGWSSIKSVGFKDEGKPGTAVSMNVFNCAETPLVMLRDWVNNEAQMRGTKVIATEIVGPLHLKYVAAAAKEFGYEFDGKDFGKLVKVLEENMGLIGFDAAQIIEYHLQSVTPLVDLKITEFIGKLGSNEPAPGGGSASALVGAVGAALTRMVAELTIGKKKYEEYNEEMKTILAEMTKLNDHLLEAIDADTEAFNKVSAVFALPKETEEEKAARRTAMQVALKYATEVPFHTMELIADGLELTARAVGKSNTNAASDLGVAALTMKAGLMGSWLNVLINLGGVKDEAFVAEYSEKGKALLAKGTEIADYIYNEIERSL
jgi:glutamate formiminotransferase / 5-formyltetrahydrofolate cyclo-ligase